MLAPAAGPGPRLSVVTPAYNASAYLERCARNVAEQGLQEVEHIVVDGGSADGSVELLSELAGRWPHLRFLSETDRGQSDALNKGIALARAPVIGILNVDDSYEPGTLPRVVSLFEDTIEPSLLVGNCRVWGPEGNLVLVNRPARLRIWQLLLGIELVPFPLNPAGYFYHRSLHDLVGPYDESLHYAMDLDFILRAVRTASEVRHVDECWGNFNLSGECKSVAEGGRGASVAEQRRVYARHRGELPSWQRRIVTTAAAVSEGKVGELVRFVWRRPDLAARRLVYHLSRLLRGR